ncbi:MAG: AlpA family phage regulatory protein [Burkholderiales bacterium]|nr:AlpA family phage regulatory protein [Burkholderiales bacterium]
MSAVTDGIRLIRLPQVLERVGLRRSAWYLMVKQGRAPRPVRLTGRAVAWCDQEIEAWLREKIARRDAQAPCRAR